MARKDFLKEAAIVHLTDSELKEYLAYHYHTAKNLEQSKKDDIELLRLKQVAKDYENDNFNEDIKTAKARIKAARALCKARGISYRLPSEGENA